MLWGRQFEEAMKFQPFMYSLANSFTYLFRQQLFISHLQHTKYEQEQSLLATTIAHVSSSPSHFFKLW